MQQCAFYMSDGTAITAETVGHATLSQFEIEIEHVTLPFVENIELAEKIKTRLNQVYANTGQRPLVFYTFVDQHLKEVIESSKAVCFDVLTPYTNKVEVALGITATPKLHRTHSIKANRYDYRIEAMNFALANDDGQTNQNYADADVILVGVSRSGKTPTSIYLALNYGIKAANYPFIDDDMEELTLPESLKANKKKLFGLTIDPKRLAAIRNERYANSKYASIRQCRMELREVERLYRRSKIPYINTTSFSVEEISAKIMSEMGLERFNY